MARRGRRASVKPQRKNSRNTLLGVAAALAVGALLFLALGDDEGAAATDEIAHIHGLAVNPDDPREVYVATHYGLFRGVNDDGWARVGATTDDLMGFTIHPTNGSVFWSSGHPANPTPTHRNLGVQVSMDRGLTWEPIALEGVDFHAMAASPANPNHLWGYYAGDLYRSTDGGYAWQVVSEAAPNLFSLVPDPVNPEALYGTTTGGILRSTDGGATWAPVSDLPAISLTVDPERPNVLVAGTQEGIRKSTDGGATWGPVVYDADGGAVAYLAMDPTDPRTIYAATFDSAIDKTTDGGDTWTRIKAPSGG